MRCNVLLLAQLPAWAAAFQYALLRPMAMTTSATPISRTRLLGGFAALAGSFCLANQPAIAAKMSKSGFDLTPMSKEEVEAAANALHLNEIQRKVLLDSGTERSFTGRSVNGYTWDTKEKGVWVNAISGVPVFSNDAKYDSGTGWPSFYAPIDKAHVIERPDPRDQKTMPSFLQRMEVLDAKSGTHMGHVFPDGPKPTGLRYCMNTAALRFVPDGEPLPEAPKR